MVRLFDIVKSTSAERLNQQSALVAQQPFLVLKAAAIKQQIIEGRKLARHAGLGIGKFQSVRTQCMGR